MESIAVQDAIGERLEKEETQQEAAGNTGEQRVTFGGTEEAERTGA